MQSKPCKPHWRDVAKQSGYEGREDCQAGWHYLLARMTFDHGYTVLDVGAGLGKSKSRISRCFTQDIYPGAKSFVDIDTPIEDIENRWFDVVTAFDVIEHVADDVTFLHHMMRIARQWVFITTPNHDVSKAGNGYHCREYTPLEFVKLVDGLVTYGEDGITLWAGDGDGYRAVEMHSDFLAHNQPHQAALIKNAKSKRPTS